jgi:hypothetical protein
LRFFEGIFDQALILFYLKDFMGRKIEENDGLSLLLDSSKNLQKMGKKYKFGGKLMMRI